MRNPGAARGRKAAASASRPRSPPLPRSAWSSRRGRERSERDRGGQRAGECERGGETGAARKSGEEVARGARAFFSVLAIRSGRRTPRRPVEGRVAPVLAVEGRCSPSLAHRGLAGIARSSIEDWSGCTSSGHIA